MEETYVEIKQTERSIIGWLIRKPLKLVRYYRLLKKLKKQYKCMDYEYPELNYYMNN